MTDVFQIGDKVQVINNSDWENHLTAGAYYTITDSEFDCYGKQLINVGLKQFPDAKFYSTRFILVDKVEIEITEKVEKRARREVLQKLAGVLENLYYTAKTSHSADCYHNVLTKIAENMDIKFIPQQELQIVPMQPAKFVVK